VELSEAVLSISKAESRKTEYRGISCAGRSILVGIFLPSTETRSIMLSAFRISKPRSLDSSSSNRISPPRGSSGRKVRPVEKARFSSELLAVGG